VAALNEVTHIIPAHKPEAMLRDNLERSKIAVAAFVVLMNEDGAVSWETAGYMRKDILWALEQAKISLLREE
jgi:hypothetical protein